MSFEDRCDTQAISAHNRSWEPDMVVAWNLLLACVELAGALRNYCEDGSSDGS